MSHHYSVLKTMRTVTSTGTEPEGTLYTACTGCCRSILSA